MDIETDDALIGIGKLHTPVNVVASVQARLLKLAREEHQPFDVLLVRLALERARR
jgi:hypothetical protein